MGEVSRTEGLVLGSDTGEVEPATANEVLGGVGRDIVDVAVGTTLRGEGLIIGVDTEDVAKEAGRGWKFTLAIAMEAVPLCIGTTDIGIGTVGEAPPDAAKLPGGGSMASPPIAREEVKSSE